jgi:ATP-dependent RNA helicase RhlE
MLDMGFLPDIRRVLRQIPKPQQTLLFSATLPPAIRGLANELLREPVAIDVERVAAPATGVRQAIFPVREDLKPALLEALLRSEKIASAIVFTRTKHRTNRLAEHLASRGIPCARLHGNRSQAQRTDALGGFRDGRFQVLVATDVAARGIDVDDLSHVINFDVPQVPEDYIHRVGRTARAGATGEAWTFVSQAEQGDLRAIERAVGKPIPQRRLAGFDYAAPAAPPLEIPIGQRIAEIRARKADERARAKAKADRKAASQAQPGPRQPQRPGTTSPRASAPAHAAGAARHGGTSHVPAALRHGGPGHGPAPARTPAGNAPRPEGASSAGTSAAPRPSGERFARPRRRRF